MDETAVVKESLYSVLESLTMLRNGSLIAPPTAMLEPSNATPMSHTSGTINLSIVFLLFVAQPVIVFLI